MTAYAATFPLPEGDVIVDVVTTSGETFTAIVAPEHAAAAERLLLAVAELCTEDDGAVDSPWATTH